MAPELQGEEMKYLKMLGLAAVAAMALMAFVGAGAASATTLEIGGVTQNKAVTITASLESGTSAVLKDEFGTTTDTCTSSHVHGTTTLFTAPGTAEIHGNVTELTFANCTHTTKVLKPGKIYIGWEEGTTNANVTSAEAEVTVQSTFFGASAVCKTGAGTKIGTLTGVASGFATIHINAKINCGILGTSGWTGAYTVTSPNGLGVEQ
jgi:hypothetical protein